MCARRGQATAPTRSGTDSRVAAESRRPVDANRELLADGIKDCSGEGDITIEPASDDHSREVRITLATDCLATMLASRAEIIEFLVATYAVVPTGSEFDRIDWDAEIGALLS